MSAISDLDMACQTIEALVKSPEVTADIAAEAALNALDVLVELAARESTAHHVMAQRVFIGQIVTRAQLVASFLMARQPQFRR